MNKVVYVAVGENYRIEAEKSLISLKSTNSIHTCLITDIEPNSKLWDEVILLQDPSFSIRDKLRMIDCECDKCLFIDSDTLIADDLSDVFDLLDRFEIVARQDGVRRFYKLTGIPDSFPELNTGVMAFRRNTRVMNFFKLWKHYFDKFESQMGREMDQRSFRKAAFESDIKLFVLPLEYNLMNITMGDASVKVKIVHGRPFNDLMKIEKEINNKVLVDRVYIPKIGVIFTVPEISVYGFINHIRKFIQIMFQEIISRLQKKINSRGKS